MLVLIALMLALAGTAGAQSITCGKPVANRVTCTFGGGLTFPLPTLRDTVRITITLPPVHDSLYFVNGVWATVKPPVIAPPPPAPPPVTVTLSALRVSPRSVTLAYGDSARFTATATWTDGSTTMPAVVWDGHCAAVTPSGWFVAHANCGPVTVPMYATLQGRADTALVTIVAPSTPPGPPPVVPPPPPGPPPGPSTLPPHPRVWLTPARLAFVRAQAAANSVRWLKVNGVADASVAAGAGGDPWTMPDLCLAYLVTGDQKYASETATLLASFATAGNTSQSGSAYPYRYDLPVVTKALDWCYAGLTVAQRRQAATWLMDHADWVWTETNPARVGGWAVTDPGNNYYWGFMMTGPAALAAADDDARAATHQQIALTHWRRDVVPFLASGDAGGAWQEGTGYDTNGRIAMFADAFTTAGTPLSDSIFNDMLRWRFASTTPGYQYHFPLGDQARVSAGPSYWYDRLAVEHMRSVADGSLSGQSQYWINALGMTPPYEDSYGDLANELVLYDPAAPATDLSAQPLGYVARGAGVVTYRQSWTDPMATAWVFQAGPLQSHNRGAGNSLRIWKGAFWISADANIYSASGIEQESVDFNTLTVGGAGQTYYGGSQLVGTPQLSGAVIVARGQAASAYQGRDVNAVSDAQRVVAYLPDMDAFVVVDRVTADASQSKVWRWHLAGVPTISGNTFTLANADARCVGTVLLPTDAVLGSQAFNLGSGGALSSHAVTVTLPARGSDVVVTVLQCSAVAPSSATVGSTAVSVAVGARTVTIPNDPAQAVTAR